MIDSMTKKLAISLPDHVADKARSAVQHGRAPSVSAYIAQAVDAYEEPITLGEFLAELDREFGPVPTEVRVDVDRRLKELDDPRRASTRPKAP
jgi:Arc/MetJ-type ribon-helix-helix transcriptional regulator